MDESLPSAQFTPRPVAGARTTARGLLLITVLWRKLTQKIRASYRPERHYMRGPGPKWHERNTSDPA